MAVQPHVLDDQTLEMSSQIIGKKEASQLLFHQAVKSVTAGIEGIAVGAGNALDPFLGTDLVEQAAGAAVGVNHVDSVIALRARRTDTLAQALGNLVRAVVQDSR